MYLLHMIHSFLAVYIFSSFYAFFEMDFLAYFVHVFKLYGHHMLKFDGTIYLKSYPLNSVVSVDSDGLINGLGNANIINLLG